MGEIANMRGDLDRAAVSAWLDGLATVGLTPPKSNYAVPLDTPADQVPVRDGDPAGRVVAQLVPAPVGRPGAHRDGVPVDPDRPLPGDVGVGRPRPRRHHRRRSRPHPP